MAELANRSGLSVATIKYYQRERLLHPGTATGATRTSYDETHVRRLRLIRALTDIAGLSLETVGQVIDGIDGAGSWHDAVGSAHTRLAIGSADPPPTPASLDRIAALLVRQGWELPADHPQVVSAARTLDALVDLDYRVGDDLLDLYAAAMYPVAEYEVASVRPDSPGPDSVEASIEAVVIGTLVPEPLILAIRRMAQENISRQL